MCYDCGLCVFLLWWLLFCLRDDLCWLVLVGFVGSLLLLVFLVRFHCFVVWVVGYNLLCFLCVCVDCVFFW